MHIYHATFEYVPRPPRSVAACMERGVKPTVRGLAREQADVSAHLGPPQPRKQLDDPRALIARAETDGHTRLAEMNRTVETNLLTIITTLQADQHDCPVHRSAPRNTLQE